MNAVASQDNVFHPPVSTVSDVPDGLGRPEDNEKGSFMGRAVTKVVDCVNYCAESKVGKCVEEGLTGLLIAATAPVWVPVGVGYLSYVGYVTLNALRDASPLLGFGSGSAS